MNSLPLLTLVGGWFLTAYLLGPEPLSEKEAIPTTPEGVERYYEGLKQSAQEPQEEAFQLQNEAY